MWRGPIHPGTEARGPRAGRPPRLRAALIPFILFLTQPAPAPAQAGTRVKVRIEGVEGALERNVRAVMEIARAAENGPMPRARAGQLHNRAEQDIGVALEPFGYYRPGVEKSLKQEGDELVARYVIDPGPVVRLRTVSVELSGPGADAPAFREAAAAFPLRAGDTLRHVPYEAGKLLLLQVSSDSGYLDADFDTSVVHVDRERGSADITVRFRTGPRFRFGPVTFEQDILDPAFLRTRVAFRPGDPWQQHRLLELQTALAEDPYFARVEVLPRREAADDSLRVPVRVVLEPRSRQEIEVGLGYGTDTGPRGRTASLWRWLNRRGHHAEAELRLAFLEQSATAQYKIPAVGHPTGLVTFAAGYARRDPRTSDSRALTGAVKFLRRRLGWRETLSLSYQRESFEVGLERGVANLLILGGSWERSRKDERVFPRRGLTTRAAVQGSRSGLVASTSFLRLEAGADAIYGFARRMRVLARTDLGYLFTGEFGELPPSIRFFTGGDRSVRGFAHQDLGARDPLGNVVGGSALVVGSLEVDFQVHNNWTVAVFTDAGSATHRLGFGDLEQGVGGGIRFISPVGPIRVDAAFAVSRPGAPFRLHLSVGPDL